MGRENPKKKRGRENPKKIGDKKDNLSLLSFEDFKQSGIAIDPNWTRLQALLVVTSLASVKLEQELKKPVESDEFCSFLISREQERVLEQPLGIFEDKSSVSRRAEGRFTCPAQVSDKVERLLTEKALKKPIKRGSASASASAIAAPVKGKLLSDAMRSRRFSYKEDDERNVEHINKKKKKLKRDNDRVVIVGLPQNFKEFIENTQNGTNIVLVIQKFLYATDISENHNRLSIPVNQIRGEFLTEEEKKDLDRAGSMKVVLVEPSLNTCNIVLKKWVMQKGYNSKKEKAKNSCSYVLIKEWNNVKLRNELKEGDEVQLWSFRNLDKLSLALVLVRRRETANAHGS